MTYPQLAAEFGVPLCSGCDHQRSHRAGFVTDHTVHWAPRRIYRRGLYRFFKLVWWAFPLPPPRSDAEALWRANRFAYLAAASRGIRLPASFADIDRGKVAYLLQRQRPGTMAAEDVQRARRWTIR